MPRMTLRESRTSYGLVLKAQCSFSKLGWRTTGSPANARVTTSQAHTAATASIGTGPTGSTVPEAFRLLSDGFYCPTHNQNSFRPPTSLTDRPESMETIEDPVLKQKSCASASMESRQ